jgi:transcriptional regulator with XRE-family HTH domain
MQITSDQLRAARALLRLDQAELARRAHVSVVTIRRLEGAAVSKPVSAEVLDSVRTALEQAGAAFIPNGVQTRRTPADIEARYRAILEIARHSAEEWNGRDILTDDDMYDENGLPW